MPSSDDQNHIDELQKSLYSRDAPDVRTRRKLRFASVESDLKTSWEHPPEDNIAPAGLNQEYKDHTMSFLTKFLIGSFIFCLTAVGLGAYLFFNGSNLISGDNIEISIRGPVSIPGGVPVSFDIEVINNNNVQLEGVDLAVDFPEGATNPDDPTKELKTFRELIGDIPPGGSATKTVSAIIFGEENLQKQIVVNATYKVKGSTALFTKNTPYAVLINSSPILLTVDSFDEITSGQEFDMKIRLKSNSQDTLKNVILKASYPFGYTFVSSDIQPFTDNNTWKIGDIPPGAERVVSVHGSIYGEDSETRVFRFSAGAQSSVDPKSIGTQYMSVDQSLTIEKPFVSLAIFINGDESLGDHVSQFDQNERVTIAWFNNLTSSISNMSIRAKLSGSAYDKSYIQPDQGYFNSANNEIVWDPKTTPELASVGAGDSGTVSFTFSPRDKMSDSGAVVGPTVVVSTDVSGKRSQGSGVPEKLSSIVSRTTKVSSNIGLTARVLRTVGPFQNTGPIPPKAEQKTAYTILWTVDNTSNTVGNAVVTAKLPAQVEWLGKINPSNERITYDENNGIVTWNIGNVDTYTKNSARRKEVYFQVGIVPSINQVDQSPTLIEQAKLTAVDLFTGAELQSTQDYLTTRFSTDPNYKEGQSTVVK